MPPFLLDSLSSEEKDLMRFSHVDSLEEEKRIDLMSSLEVDVMGVGMRSGGERHAAEKEKNAETWLELWGIWKLV